MAVEVKFCGITRRADAELAAALGARFVGVIFAGGPRCITPGVASALLRGLAGVGRVGVFGTDTPDALGAAAREASLDVVQLHADPDAGTIDAARATFAAEVWATVRLRDLLPRVAESLFAAADAVVLDARSDSGLGGTGISFDWSGVRTAVAGARARGGARLVLAGGLTPANVGEGIAALEPDIVDVSSGVERSPGVKDPDLMRAFIEAVHSAAPRR